MRAALLHASCPDGARDLENAISAAGADVEWDSHGSIGAVVGVYTGPGAVGCAYFPIG
jgi:fatty acid-binding protein DegV